MENNMNNLVDILTEKLKISSKSKVINNKEFKKDGDILFDNTIVNYYKIEWTDKYMSMAGPQKELNRIFFIIWDSPALSTANWKRLFRKWISSITKTNVGKKLLNSDCTEVKSGPLYDIYDQYKDSPVGHYTSEIIDCKDPSNSKIICAIL